MKSQDQKLAFEQRVELQKSYDTVVVTTDGVVHGYRCKKGQHKSIKAKDFQKANKGSVLIRL